MSAFYDYDLHIHSQISLCSGDPAQTPARILQYAQDHHLNTLCLTDHFWDADIPGASDFYKRQDFAHIAAAQPLPQADGVRFLFGCETEMDRHMRLGIPRRRFDDFNFVIIPTTHFHMTGFTIPADCTAPQQKSQFWLDKLNALLDMNLPFRKIGVAHLTCGLIDPSRETYLEILRGLGTDDLAAVFRKAARAGVGIELNADDMNFAPDEQDTVLRPYRIARDVGCKFYCGSDAHHPQALDAAPAIFARAVAQLELTEAEKFTLA